MLNLGLFIPELTLAITALAIILFDLFVERKGWLVAVSLIGLIIAAGSLVVTPGSPAQTIFNNMLVVDGFAFFFKLLFLGISALVILASTDYVSKFTNFRGEYYALVILSTLGMMLMAATSELVTIYISLELTSISLYVLAGFLKDSKSTEASLKYLLLGAISSAVLLFGMALVFGSTGQTQLGQIAGSVASLSATGVMANPALVLGIVLLVAGFGFKVAAFPFHMWVPDVYEGAPTPVVAFLSVGSKAAGFALILRVFSTAFGFTDWLSINFGLVFAGLAAIGMFVGNLSALPQTNIKRMLGYSSIAQAGYLMVGLATMGISPPADILGQSGVLFFLAGYALANLGTFTAIIAISNKLDSDFIQDYSGMIKRAPVLTLALSLCLISLIGMPPAAGFMAKFYIFSGAVQNGLLWLVIIAVLNSVVSAYYYLRVVKVMWFGEPASEEKVPSSGALRLALTVSCLGVLLIGIIPGPIMELARAAARMFTF
ncbi:MAG: NADH-quinone oxidoreductase subunit N [Dehalococcoidales bacterium]|jgi:NADH-quinone oxidoreductase subunit N|nr:NADH-quinone oxidoreductase subunit N [Dehalococcoidales bacterium]MDP6501051.1 NADH-quinone oxidoreductase subunit N [Dehalococcoidales bacterium]MDP6632995.1 NADH-quinone oxidoreductase subunit N [Dehalococcoidales bacterium]